MIQDAYPKMFERKETKKYRKCKYSDGTVKLFSTRFNNALKYAVEEGIIQKNPHSMVIVPKYGTTRIVAKSPKDRAECSTNIFITKSCRFLNEYSECRDKI